MIAQVVPAGNCSVGLFHRTELMTLAWSSMQPLVDLVYFVSRIVDEHQEDVREPQVNKYQASGYQDREHQASKYQASEHQTSEYQPREHQVNEYQVRKRNGELQIMFERIRCTSRMHRGFAKNFYG